MNAVIDEAAVDAGRAPGDVRRLLNVNGSFTGSGTELPAGPARGLGGAAGRAGARRGHERLRARRRPRRRPPLRTFAEEVAPAVRELVEAERRPAGGRSRSGSRRRRPRPSPRLPDVRPGPTPSHRRPATPPDAPGRHPRPPARRAGPGAATSSARWRAATSTSAPARSLISTMTMRQNCWTLGTYCESYCRVVTTHHTIEDTSMFPRLRAAEPRSGRCRPAARGSTRRSHGRARRRSTARWSRWSPTPARTSAAYAGPSDLLSRRPAVPPRLRGGPARRAAQPALDRVLRAPAQRSSR